MTNDLLRPQALIVELPLVPSFSDEKATLTEQWVEATLDLSGGPRTYRSESRIVGAYQGIDIGAQLSFEYEYDKDENKLTLRGNDDRTPEQLRITTFLSGSPDQAFNQAPSLVSHVFPNDIGQNQQIRNLWADHVDQSPGLAEAVAAAARRCNETLVKAAIDGGVSAVLEIGTPPLVTLDNLDDFKRMYGEPVTSEADRVADLIRMQFKVDSTYDGIVTWASNTSFANVIGSSGDGRPSGVTSWISLWKNKCNGDADPTYCSSNNYFSAAANTCNGGIVGGHVITGTTAASQSIGAEVYIFPICARHNGINTGYMKIVYNPKGVKLKYWL